MRVSLSALLCTALISVGAAAQDATLPQDKAAPQPALPAFINNIWQTVVNGGRPIDLEERAKDDADAGMTRITDDNYASLFATSRPDDVWVIAVHGRPHDLVSDGYLQMHANASSLLHANTTIADKAARFKFGRLDWMTDWMVSTRWVMTKPPYIVFVSDSGQTLRFVSPPRLAANGTTLYQALAEGYWTNLQPWHGSLAPDGDYAYLVEAYITAQTYLSKVTAFAPRWVWLALPLVTTAVGQRVMEWLHRGDVDAQRKRNGREAAQAAQKPKSQ